MTCQFYHNATENQEENAYTYDIMSKLFEHAAYISMSCNDNGDR